MPLAPRIFHSLEAREARAQAFYAGTQQRKLGGNPNKNNIPKEDQADLVPSVSAAPAPMTSLESRPDAGVAPPVLPPVATMVDLEESANDAQTVTKAGVDDLKYLQYSHDLETQYLPAIRALISKDLSEPYSIYVYRYFLYHWGHLCYMALDPENSSLIGVVVCKLETHASHSPATFRGYIAMLAVASAYRGRGIATKLVRMAIDAMADRRADEIVLETEESNTAAMRLYERLGFLRSKKLHRYYLNGSSAYRLVLGLRGISDDGSQGMKEGVRPGQIDALQIHGEVI